MKALCFTVDIDRDVNIPLKGRPEAGSFDRGQGTRARFESSGRGVEIIADMLADLNINATFFAEARALMETCAYDALEGFDVAMHGLEHEDMTGTKTGITLDYGHLRNIIEESISIIRDCTGSSPKGFRSPYMLPNEDVMEFLPEYGVMYDSSYYVYAGKEVKPYRLEGGLKEIPVVKCTDASGNPMTSYLWSMHEGQRKKEDYVQMAKSIENGVLVLSTHSWHVCETQKGLLSDEEIDETVSDIRWILETLIDDGFEPMSMSEVYSKHF